MNLKKRSEETGVTITKLERAGDAVRVQNSGERMSGLVSVTYIRSNVLLSEGLSCSETGWFKHTTPGPLTCAMALHSVRPVLPPAHPRLPRFLLQPHTPYVVHQLQSTCGAMFYAKPGPGELKAGLKSEAATQALCLHASG